MTIDELSYIESEPEPTPGQKAWQEIGFDPSKISTKEEIFELRNRIADKLDELRRQYFKTLEPLYIKLRSRSFLTSGNLEMAVDKELLGEYSQFCREAHNAVEKYCNEQDEYHNQLKRNWLNVWLGLPNPDYLFKNAEQEHKNERRSWAYSASYVLGILGGATGCLIGADHLLSSGFVKYAFDAFAALMGAGIAYATVSSLEARSKNHSLDKKMEQARKTFKEKINEYMEYYGTPYVGLLKKELEKQDNPGKVE